MSRNYARSVDGLIMSREGVNGRATTQSVQTGLLMIRAFWKQSSRGTWRSLLQVSRAGTPLALTSSWRKPSTCPWKHRASAVSCRSRAAGMQAIAEMLVEAYLEAAEVARTPSELHRLQALAQRSIARLAWLRALA